MIDCADGLNRFRMVDFRWVKVLFDCIYVLSSVMCFHLRVKFIKQVISFRCQVLDPVNPMYQYDRGDLLMMLQEERNFPLEKKSVLMSKICRSKKKSAQASVILFLYFGKIWRSDEKIFGHTNDTFFLQICYRIYIMNNVTEHHKWKGL